MPDDFEAYWRKAFPDCDPAGYMLREQLPERWWRLHSLPLSKRYPDDENEMKIVLHRANAVASDILGNGAACWTVSSVFHKLEEKFQTKWEQKVQHPHDMQRAFKWQAYDDEQVFHAYAGSCCWWPIKQNDLLSQLANDEARDILWISKKTDAIFAPYAGGVDIFMPPNEGVEDYKKKYRMWLSEHPDGM